ncbi:MAG: hypothetical protein K6L75_14165 [Cellvibrionaceae bacterium]
MKPNILFLLGLLLFIQGCATTQPRCNSLSKIDEEGLWYKKFYRGAGVRPLCAHSSNRYETYRLVILRTFHNPIFIDLEKAGSRIEVSAVRLNGAGGYSPGKPVEYKSSKVSTEEFKKFKQKIASVDFWNLMTEDEKMQEANKNNEDVIIVMDGAVWIFEGASYNTYHIFDRHSDYEDELWEIGNFLIKKSRINTNGGIY